jgi:ribose 5-phosphate isomerase B
VPPSLPTGGASAPTKAASGAQGTASRPSIAIGADHGGVALKAAIAKRLRELGHDVADVGTNSTDAVDYPDFAETVARMVGEGRVAFGIMIDGAGIGSCMAANKVARVRAAMCYDVTTAANAREHNFANVLTLGAGLIGERLALAIVETFLATPTGAERHAARVAKIDALDRRG